MPIHNARPAGSLGKAMKVHGAAGLLVRLALRQLKLNITSPVMASQPYKVNMYDIVISIHEEDNKKISRLYTSQLAILFGDYRQGNTYHHKT